MLGAHIAIDRRLDGFFFRRNRGFLCAAGENRKSKFSLRETYKNAAIISAPRAAPTATDAVGATGHPDPEHQPLPPFSIFMSIMCSEKENTLNVKKSKEARLKMMGLRAVLAAAAAASARAVLPGSAPSAELAAASPVAIEL